MVWWILLAMIAGVIGQRLSSKENIILWTSRYIFFFGLPLIILDSILKSDFGGVTLIALFVYKFVLLFLTFYLVKQLPFPRRQLGVMLLNGSIGNYGLLGIPLTFLIFGEKGAIMATLLTVIMGMLHLTLGVQLAAKFDHQGNVENKWYKNMFFYVVIGGFILKHFAISFPDWIASIHPSTTLIAVFLVGISMHLDITEVKRHWKQISLTLGEKFFFTPLFGYGVLTAFGLPLEDKLILLFTTTMPCAVSNTAIAKKLKLDHRLSGTVIALGTGAYLFVLAIVTTFL